MIQVMPLNKTHFAKPQTVRHSVKVSEALEFLRELALVGQSTTEWQGEQKPIGEVINDLERILAGSPNAVLKSVQTTEYYLEV